MKKLITLLLVGILGLLALIAASAEEASPKLVLSETEVRVAVGKSVSLKATVENPSAGKKGKATWESSDPAVCTVSASGAVRAVSEGTAIISCTQELPEDGILTAVCSVTTFTEAKSLKPVNRDIRLNVGETVQAEYTLLPEETTEKMLDWISANEAVVTVNAEGKLTAVGPGTVKVTAQTRDGSNKKASCEIKVTNPASSISISSSVPRMSSDRYYLAFGKSAKNTPVFADTYGKPANQKVSQGTAVTITGSDNTAPNLW